MAQNSITYQIKPGGALHGNLRVPGDKSISHRAIMLGAIAEGVTHISGFLASADCLATLQAFRDMGVHIEQSTHIKKLAVHGVGLHGLQAPVHMLDMGNSGTAIRLLTGLLAGQRFNSQLTGDASLQRRPMGRIVEPLRYMGAHITMHNENYPPLQIRGVENLHGMHYQMPVASAQVKSGILLAGLYAQGEVIITERAPTRDHTERLLAAFGYPIHHTENTVRLIGQKKLTATRIHIPADISSAAFFMVGATIAPGSDIILEHVGINPTRIGVIHILQQMGANIVLLNERMEGGEPIADIHVQYSELRGIDIPAELVSLAIDEFPVLFIAAACAQGVTRLHGAEELRVKESDRIQTMVDGLRILGIKAEAQTDGAIIEGGQLQGGAIESHGDHRVAMAFAIAGLRATGTIQINDCANVATSFPHFVSLAQKAGLNIQDV